MPNYRPAGDSDSFDSDDDGFTPFDSGHGHQNGGVTTNENEVSSEPWRESAFGDGSVSFDSSVAVGLSKIDKFRNALLSGDLDQVKVSLDIDQVDKEHCFHGMYSSGTPLTISASQGHVDVVEFLLKRGAANAPDESGVTPFMAIFQSSQALGHEDNNFENRLLQCAELFLKLRGIEINVNSSQNQLTTALMMAAKEGHPKLVKFLIESGEADLNLVDSQQWTALCFAANYGFGNVVRILLEKGADPDIPNRDGMFAADLAGARGMDKLQTVIDDFSKRDPKRSTKIMFGPTSGVITQFSEMDNVLLGLDLAHYTEHFARHNVSLEIFLGLSEADLIEIGVDELGSRKKILHAIADIFKKDWEKTSLARINPRDKQNGLYFTAPDCVRLSANMTDHAKFLEANVRYMTRQLKEHPELLTYGQDIAGVEALSNHVSKCRRSVSAFYHSVSILEREVVKLARDPKYLPADLVKRSSKKKFTSLLSCRWIYASIILGVGAVLCYKIIC